MCGLQTPYNPGPTQAPLMVVGGCGKSSVLGGGGGVHFGRLLVIGSLCSHGSSELSAALWP